MTADDIVLRTKLARCLLQNPSMSFITLHEASCLYRTHSSNTSANLPRQLISVSQYLDKYWPQEQPSSNFRDLVLNAFANTKDRQALYKRVKNYTTVQKVLQYISVDDLIDERYVCYKKKNLLGIFHIYTYKHLGMKWKVYTCFKWKLFISKAKSYQ